MGYEKEKLIELRKKSGLTQKELADALHVSASSVSKWECGTAVPDVFILESMAGIFQIPLADIIEKEGMIEEQDIIIIEKPEDTGGDWHTEVPETKGTRKRKEVREGKAIWCVTGICMALLVIGIILYQSSSTFRGKVVDEFSSSFSIEGEYENVYYIALEYKGKLSMETGLNYPEDLRERYVGQLNEADAIYICYFKKYPGRDEFFESINAYSVFTKNQKYFSFAKEEEICYE